VKEGEGRGAREAGGVIYADVVQLHGGGGLRGVCSGCWAMGDEPCVAGAGIVERSSFVAMCVPVRGREYSWRWWWAAGGMEEGC